MPNNFNPDEFNRDFEMALITDQQPHAIEAERSLIGSCMNSEDACVQILDLVKPDYIYSDNHRLIYNVIVELFQAAIPVDMITVSDKLRDKGQLEQVGGSYQLSEIASNYIIASNLFKYCEIIKQKHLKRKLIELSKKNIELARADEDIYEVYDHSLEGHGKILDEGNEERQTTVKQSVTKLYEQILSPQKTSGLQTGFNHIDENLYGLRNGKLIVVAARPGMGKTAYALQLAMNIAQTNNTVGIISLEMDSEEITKRMLSNQSATELSSIELNEVPKEKMDEVTKAVDEIAKMPILIKELASNIVQVRTTAKRWKIQRNLKCLIVDYLQLMDGKQDGNREQEISSLSRGLKRLAMELQIPVIALSQLSRQVENRGGEKQPILSDLRESGAIEQDADAVIMLWRPEYYDFESFEMNNWKPLPNTVKNFLGAKIVKNRGGQLGMFSMSFFGATQKITNLQGTGQFPVQSNNKDLPF